ncbi:hypothetical protein tinsulaeT_10840 [Thalassotalea insulae]|uniref:Acyl transferase domain-containing protein n=1 Tax=Thalassotalea insulae TaxID=2056778 RepID=A0ABQ6GQ56_9GAMM|nr:type I polyketide synthase [Thalassotalea insulae]GLX77744.1 hypothetical protein tinsulaeT_10840 [Thalassotalea insulae]
MLTTNKEPLAIVGIGCRYPGGANDVESFWQMLAEGVDGISQVPMERWDQRKFFDKTDNRPGKTKVMQGGYIKQSLKKFDPLFFGISPREAAFTDPQQRLLLEVLWETFEDAGLTQDRYQGSNTGVFIGAFNLDNLLLQLGRDNLEKITSSTAASVTMTMLSNRLSYTFDLKGPSLTIDTACSSSMVSTHYACQSIWNGECEMAISGGVNVISRPEYMVSMSKGGFLSSHGRCKSFDADAQGYVRGEGAGIILIKPLAKALEDNDHIYSVIRNTGVNQDGHTQNGISFPSSTSQKALIKQVYKEANINPLDVSYIEAHGTGTQAGDPIEIDSLASTFTPKRSAEKPCYVGSIKSNIGHTESAAGVAGIIKASLSIEKGIIPPNLHFNNPNPNIDFKDGVIQIPVENTVWDEGNKPRMASVNSFGYGGTNGHIILEQHINGSSARKNTKNDTALNQHPLHLIPLSAKTTDALKEVCQKLFTHLQSSSGQNISIDELNYTLALRRTALQERVCFVVSDKENLIEKLAQFARGEVPEGCVTSSQNSDESQGLVFVFTGMGPQWWKMGQELYHKSPIFKSVVDECDNIFYKISGWSIKAEMLATEAESNMARTRVAQPANFIIQAGLLALYKSWGIQPSAVVGHSVGEVASAYASGALTLSDALKVSFHRSRLQQTVAGQGSMLAIGMGGQSAFDLADMYDEVSVAAVNSNSSVTLAGNEEQLEEIAGILEQQGIFNRILAVEVAYHSYQMDPIKDELISVLSDITPNQETTLLYSTATGQAISGTQFDANYWWDNVRQPVSFEKAIKQLIDDGYQDFVEIGPHPVTRNFISECLSDKQTDGKVIPSLIRKQDEQIQFFQSLACIFNQGYKLQWPDAVVNANYCKLPNYPWQREEYWNESKLSNNFLLGSGEQHPFFYEKLMTPEPSWQVEINDNFFPFLPDHKISTRVVFPGAGYVEAGLALQKYQKNKDASFTIENLKFYRMLMIDEEKAQQLRIVENQGQYRVYSSDVNNDNWTLNASGELIALPVGKNAEPVDLTSLKATTNRTINIEELYRAFAKRGLGYDAHFQTIKEIHAADNVVIAKLVVNQDESDNDFDQYQIYPTLLDGAFQSLIALTDNTNNATPMVPVEVGQITLYRQPGKECWCVGELIEQTGSAMTCSIKLIDATGEVLVELQQLVCQALASEESEQLTTDITQCFYQYQWLSTEQDTTELNTSDLLINENWLIIADHSDEKSFKVSQAIQARASDANGQYSSIDLSQMTNNTESDDYLDELSNLVSEYLQKGITQLIYIPDCNTTPLDSEETVNQCISQSLPMVSVARCISNLTLDNVKNNEINFVFISQGSQAVTPVEKINAAQSAISSLTHLLGNEIANIQPRHIDFSGEESYFAEEMSQLWIDLTNKDNCEDIAYRGDLRFVKVLAAKSVESGEQNVIEQHNSQTSAIAIDLTAQSSNQGGYQLILPSSPGDGQITIRLHSAHTNAGNLAANKQPLNALSVPHVAMATVVESESKEFGKGDLVVALITDQTLSNVVTLSESYCEKLEKDIQPEIALRYIGQLSALATLDSVKEKLHGNVFIQNGHTTTGTALIQLALAQNCKVYTTAPTSILRQELAELGVSMVADNSDLSYISQLNQSTNNEKFALVINDLNKEHFTHCFKLLSESSLYCHVAQEKSGVLNFPESAQLPDNYQYCSVNVLNRLITDTSYRSEYHVNWLAAVRDNKFSQVAEARINFSQWPVLQKLIECADETAPIRIDFDNANIEIHRTDNIPSVNRQSTYLITGGTDGLGLEIARWLANQGVQSLALVSRKGSTRTQARNFVEEMEKRQINVQLFDVNITDKQAVTDLVKDIESTMLPLKGIIHGAMVLDDDLTVNMNAQRMKYVLEPKVAGAINLHNATKNISLDHFICFSSISSIIGNIGQTNYVAANAYLDAFAQQRHQQGLSSTTINLGVLQEIGVVSRDQDLANILTAKGLKGFTTNDVLKGLGYLLNEQPRQVGFFDIDWSAWAQESPKSSASSRFKGLVEKAKANSEIPAGLVSLLELIDDQEAYFSRLKEILSIELSQLLNMSVDDISSDRSISELGIDSIMSVEYSANLRTKFGFSVTSMELLSGPSLDQVANTLALQISEKY